MRLLAFKHIQRCQSECCAVSGLWFTFVQKVGRLENMVGWYHSHPGYGCWLSGIDVGTQSTQQTYSEPFLAIVIDPHRTIAAGKVEIGAFRTYPEVCCPYFMFSYAAHINTNYSSC